MIKDESSWDSDLDDFDLPHVDVARIRPTASDFYYNCISYGTRPLHTEEEGLVNLHTYKKSTEFWWDESDWLMTV